MSKHIGPLRFIDGHPAPYSCTVQARVASDDGETIGDYESIPAVGVLDQIDDWMKEHRPRQKLLRVDGAYFFYGEPPAPGTDMVRLVDVMMEIVAGNISTGKARETLRNEGYPPVVWQRVLAPLQE